MRILIKRLLFFAMLILLLIPIYVYAGKIEVSHEDVNTRVSPSETAEFAFIVKNNGNAEDELLFSINELDIYPFSNIIESAEVYPTIAKLKAGGSTKVTAKLKIFDDATPNINYKTYLVAKSTKNPDVRVKDYIVVSVLSPNDLVEITTTFPDRIVAGNDLEFNISLKNKVNLILKDIDVSVSSEFFQETFKTNIYYGLPLIKKIKYDIDSSTKPGKYTLSVKIYYKKQLRGNLLKEFEIVKNQNVVEKSETESSFLLNVYRFERENKGNVVMEEGVFLPLGYFERVFTTSNIKPTKKTGEGYEWMFTLKPGEVYMINAKTDYRILFYGTIIVILFSLGIWYYMHKTILIKKQLYHVKDEHSGTAELKIILKVKNKGDPLRNVRVVDIIPGLLRPSGEYGTMKPTRIENTYTGQRIVWELPMMDIGDERILSYKLESKTPLFATITLPPAAVIYKKLSKSITKTSNRVVFVPKRKKKK